MKYLNRCKCHVRELNILFSVFFILAIPKTINAFVSLPTRRSCLTTTTTFHSSPSSSSSSSDDDTSILLRKDSNVLNIAFDALNEEDKYDAVLTGLCAKILDSKDGSSSSDGGSLNDLMDLMKEMNNRGVKGSVRSISALVDAAAKSTSPLLLSQIMSLCIRNGSISQYGSLQNTIKIPSRPSSKAAATNDDDDDDLPELPTDNRVTEIASAILFSTIVGGSFLISQNVGSGPLLINPGSETFDDGGGRQLIANVIFYGAIMTVVVDNFYDVLLGFVTFVGLALKKDLAGVFPEKGDLPLGLGRGEMTGMVGKGMTRLLSVDTERECQSEAAAFFAAYTLGLPCFAFRPNSLEAAVLVFESVKDNNTSSSPSPNEAAAALSPLLSNTGILKILIWLLSPVAFENLKHAELIFSDPRESPGFLKRLKDNSSKMSSSSSSDDKDGSSTTMSQNELNDILGDDEDVLLKWAFREADRLMRRNKRTVEDLSERLAGGVATVGDCVGVIEGWV